MCFLIPILLLLLVKPVPQQGTLDIQTEFGYLEVKSGEVAIIQRVSFIHPPPRLRALERRNTPHTHTHLPS